MCIRDRSKTRKIADAYSNIIRKMEVIIYQEEDQTGEPHTMVENGTDDTRCGNVTGVWWKIMLNVIFVIDVEGRGPDSSRAVSYTHLDVYKRQEDQLS